MAATVLGWRPRAVVDTTGAHGDVWFSSSRHVGGRIGLKLGMAMELALANEM